MGGSGLALSPGFLRALGEGAPGTGLRPYLQTPQPDSIWVNWWTDHETETRVDWGPAPDQLTNTVTGTTQALNDGVDAFRYHSAKITGLQPSTHYHYCVRSGALSSPVYRFRTAPPVGTNSGRYRVLVMGDNQILTAERRWERLMQRAKAKIEELYGVPIEESIDLILNIGDQVDVSTLNHWRYLHFEYGNSTTPYLPSMTTVGNHDCYQRDGNRLTLWDRLFPYDELNYGGVTNPGGKAYYAHQQANILFVHTNSESFGGIPAAQRAGNVQRQWVQDVVDAAAVDPTVDFIISLVHRPYQAEQYVGDISQWFRDEIMPILAQTEKHVLNLGAHHHLYARGSTRDWPIYHIINGATAWDQFWGQSTEIDFDDVQKTIANWAWQLIDFDLDNRDMRVDCYAEANVRFPESQRWTTRAYNSRLIDTFHRTLGLAPPDRPRITNTSTGGPGEPNEVELPYLLASSPFSTSTAEQLNSTQFQIAADPDFTFLRIDTIRDQVNLYGDTGAPDYEPVNANAGIDILQYEVATDSLPSSTFFARVRHRDSNNAWSDWSLPFAFTVTNSGTADPSLTLARSVFAPGTPVAIGYERLPTNQADWIGIFRGGESPSTTGAVSRQYVTGGAGTRTFRYSFLPGEYYAGLFADDTAAELAPRVPFFVGQEATLETGEPNHLSGSPVEFIWSDAPGGPRDVVAIFGAGVDPGPGIAPEATVPARTPSGSRSLSGLPDGYYYGVLLVNGGTFALSPRVSFSVGTANAVVTMESDEVPQGAEFTVSFTGGPGIPKDWIGLYPADVEPGPDLIEYLYFEGAVDGSVTFALPGLPPGDYYVAMFTNDSYTEVSNRFYFRVVAP